jgi:Ca2+-binding RTX toxin-like protein
VSINGTAGDDTLTGTPGNDTLNGLGGNDSISGIDGADSLSGGDGADTISGGTGADTMDGGTGNDSMLGGSGHDSMLGGDGDDTLDGNADSDTMDGGLGNDTYFVGFGGDFLPDQITDAGGIDTVIAFDDGFRSSWTLGPGLENLEVFGTSGTGNELDNFIRNNEPGGPGAPTLNGLGGDDTLVGSNGFDVLNGGDGNDSLNGNGGNDSVSGEAGNDTLESTTGAGETDTLDGGLGDDLFVVAGAGTAVLRDAGGVDTVRAVDMSWTLGTGFENLILALSPTVEASPDGIGNELDNVIDASGIERAGTLDGRAGDDTIFGAGISTVQIFGGDGNDTIHSEGGGRMSGGAGNDVLDAISPVRGWTYGFDVAPGAANSDVITNFQSDIIELDGNAYANAGPSGRFASGDARFFAAPGANAGHDADDRVVYNTSTGDLWYDADGNGTGAAQLIATLSGAPALAATNISIVNGTATAGTVINGTAGNDTLTGTAGNDTLNGLGGNDELVGSGGTDFFDGGGGVDTLNFRLTNTGVTVNFATGTASGGFNGTFTNMERVLGGNASDSLIGTAGGQNLSGRGGLDTLEGGAGNDTLWGGGGGEENHFVFREFGSANADQVGDFIAGADDLDVDHNAFTAAGAVGQFGATDARFFAAAGASAGHDADDRFVYNTTTGQFFYDDDGSGAHAAQLVATLQGAPSLAATDITVI